MQRIQQRGAGIRQVAGEAVEGLAAAGVGEGVWEALADLLREEQAAGQEGWRGRAPQLRRAARDAAALRDKGN